MHDAESILVIIVSSTLTLFLIMAIIVLVLAAKLLAAITRIVTKAEQVVDTAEAAAQMLKDASGPLALFKLIKNMVATVEKMQGSKKGGKEL